MKIFAPFFFFPPFCDWLETFAEHAAATFLCAYNKQSPEPKQLAPRRWLQEPKASATTSQSLAASAPTTKHGPATSPLPVWRLVELARLPSAKQARKK